MKTKTIVSVNFSFRTFSVRQYLQNILLQHRRQPYSGSVSKLYSYCGFNSVLGSGLSYSVTKRLHTFTLSGSEIIFNSSSLMVWDFFSMEFNKVLSVLNFSNCPLDAVSVKQQWLPLISCSIQPQSAVGEHVIRCVMLTVPADMSKH